MKAIIFDMDGVIIDSEPIHKQVEIKLLKELGGTITDEEYTKFVGTTDQHMWLTFKKQFNLQPTVEEMINIKKKRFINQIHKIPLVSDINNVLDACAAENYLIALASSNVREAVNEVIDHFCLADYFQATMSGEDIIQSKPNPEIFLKTAMALNVSPTKCIVIEDAKNGIEAAKAAGMKCIGFDNYNSGPQDLSKADITIDNFKEINLEIIKNLLD